MNFEVQETGNYVVIKTKVEKLDTNHAPELKSILVFHNKNNVKNIIIDLTDSRYCDSSGLSALLVANRLCKNAGGSFILTGLQEPVQKLIQISQLHTVLAITPKLNDAIDHLAASELSGQ
jgi:anti-anti-sigma factor